jgi:predicted DNA-binding ribbon-helix-helix protein
MAHRILQHAGRRYSLKLDEIVWETLEELAADSDLRLNELVARVAQETGDDDGLTNALRNYCLRELRQRLAQRDAEIKTLTLTSRGVPAALIAQACPAPCFLIGNAQIIQEANEPAQKWMSTPAASLIGKIVDHYLQIKSVPPIEEIVRQFREGARKLFAARVLHLRPGRLVMARANLCPAMIDAEKPADFGYFLIIQE